MGFRLDDILNCVDNGSLKLDDACRAIAGAAREHPDAVQLWPMLIEARVTQQRLSAAAARALTEALQNFEPEKTLWLRPAKSRRANEQKPPAMPIAKKDNARVENTEQLRSLLWDAERNVAALKREPAIVQKIPTPAAPPRTRPGMLPALPALELGTVLKNRYRLESRLGYGGIGQVFSAIDMEVERNRGDDPRVTVKVVAVDLRREPQALMSMKMAVAKIKSLRHKNIVRTIAVDSDGERLFITMEPLVGRWLGERIRSVRDVGVSLDTAWPIIEQIASGLAYAHENGIVHSDLSPYAVFLSSDGTPKIMGFGLIHALPTSNEALDLMDTMTLRAYTEAYAANTWATHATPHPADDLYPLGVIAYELLTGKHPFQRCSLRTARQRNLPLVPVPGLKRRAAKLIEHCLSFERNDRPDDAAGFLNRMYGSAWLRLLFG